MFRTVQQYMFRAVEKGDVRIVDRHLLRGFSPEVCSNIFNHTPLHYAAWCNSTEVEKLLISYQANIEAQDEYNRTPLHRVAEDNSTDVVQLLITHQANIEARDEYNRTPLHRPAVNNSTSCATINHPSSK